MNTAMAARKYVLCAEAVGTPAADRNENRKAQEIGGESQLQYDGVGAEVLGDGRQRRGNHRRVHVFHEQGGSYDERKQAGWGDHFNAPKNAKLFRFTQCCGPMKAHALKVKPHATTS